VKIIREANPFFIRAGAEAFRHDNPNATVQFLDTGHFALETHLEEIALAMRDFLGMKPQNVNQFGFEQP
jgi:hypothetical protein